jgi:hypothetical protein
LLEAPPCAVAETARAILTPEQAKHPLHAEAIEIARQAEIEVAQEMRQLRARAETRKKESILQGAKPECY